MGGGPGVREARYATKHPTVHRTALHNENHLVQTPVVPKVGLSQSMAGCGTGKGLAEVCSSS